MGGLVQRYTQLLFDRPVVFLITIPLITVSSSLFVLYRNPVSLSLDAESVSGFSFVEWTLIQGFDTSSTSMSGSRLAWQDLAPSLAHGSRIPITRQKRSWADDLLTAFTHVPCYEEPIPGSEFFIDYDFISLQWITSVRPFSRSTPSRP